LPGKPARSSAAKRHTQSLKRRLRNKMVKTRIRTSTRQFTDLLNANAREEAQKKFDAVAGLLDRAASRGIIHRNTAARKKRRLHRMLAGPQSAS